MDHSLLARKTLDGLEKRLQRLQAVIYGEQLANGHDEQQSQSITTRLKSLNKALDKFEQQSVNVQAIIRSNQDSHTRVPQASHDTVITPEDDRLAAAVVLAHAKHYNTVATQLRSIEDASIDNAAPCVAAISQAPRVALAGKRAEQQQREMAELRERSTKVIQRWHDVGVLSLQDALGEWEDRLMAAERKVRQDAARRQRGEGLV